MNAAIVRSAIWQVEFAQDMADVTFDRLWGEPEAFGDAPVGQPFGHQLQDFALTVGQLCEGITLTPALDEARDKLRVDDDPAGRDAGRAP